MSEGAPQTTPSTEAPKPRVRVRRAGWRDVRPLVRMYLSLTPSARHMYHPFPFNRVGVGAIYSALVGYQWIARPLMRRWTSAVAMLVVTEIDGVAEPVGSGTLHGEHGPGGEAQLRFGFVVREGYRGFGLGPKTLIGLAEQGVALGYQRGVGSVHTTAPSVIALLQRLGWQVSPSTFKDKGAPMEVLYETTIDIRLLAAAQPP